ncbi:MAG: asparaginase [Phycisphaeraceae bacterium]|nr:asparaginase [Phycisphaeraceae bacterium]
MPARSITIITTGGTIEKTYDEASGLLVNRGSILREMLGRLRLEDTSVSVIDLLSKDSLYMTDEDRKQILDAARETLAAGSTSGIVILHGTDTLCTTGELLHASLRPNAPVILTGAMRPYEMTRSDALQNLTEALFATGVLPPGVYCVAHGRALKFPGVVKDKARGTFTEA